jgi:hypothetical protein
MHAVIKAAAAAGALLATPALAMTVEPTPSAAALQADHFLADAAKLVGGSGPHDVVTSSTLRFDGTPEYGEGGAASYGYLTSTSPAGPAKAGAQREFDNELPNYRTPGVVTYGPGMGAHAVATPQAH